jgi:pimeloyl-ACP methyl ester carboxylesterase
MADATISRVRVRDLARLSRSGPAAAGGAGLRFATSSLHRGHRPRRSLAASPQTHQLTPRSRRSHGINHLVVATFVLVHGAWHGGWCWRRVEPLLREAGHDVLTPTLTGLGERAHLLSPQVGLQTHVDDVVGMLAYERRDDVVLVGHSYAGQVVTGVASARPEGIARVVYLDAFVPQDGASAIDLLPPEIAAHYRDSVRERGFGWLIPPRGLDVLGVTDAKDVAWLESRLVPHPWRTYTEPVTATAAAADVPSAFVECTDWLRVFHPFAEIAAARGWPVHELASGHEAMVTHPRELAAVLLELAR